MQGFGPVGISGENLVVYARTFNSIDEKELGQGTRAYASDDFMKTGTGGILIVAKTKLIAKQT